MVAKIMVRALSAVHCTFLGIRGLHLAIIQVQYFLIFLCGFGGWIRKLSIIYVKEYSDRRPADPPSACHSGKRSNRSRLLAEWIFPFGKWSKELGNAAFHISREASRQLSLVPFCVCMVIQPFLELFFMSLVKRRIRKYYWKLEDRRVAQ